MYSKYSAHKTTKKEILLMVTVRRGSANRNDEKPSTRHRKKPSSRELNATGLRIRAEPQPSRLGDDRSWLSLCHEAVGGSGCSSIAEKKSFDSVKGTPPRPIQTRINCPQPGETFRRLE